MSSRKWRARSPENVVDELGLLRYKFGVKEIEFLDDIFTLNKKEPRKAGCHTIYLGVESGTQKVLNFINKKVTIKQAKKAIKVLKEAGLRVLASFIIGVPGETISDINKTIFFAKKLDPDLVQFTLLTPYPGTPLFQKAVEKDWIDTFNWRRYDVLNPVMRLRNISSKQLKKLLKKAYINFYLRPKYIIKAIKSKNFLLLYEIIKSSLRMIIGSL